MQLVLRYLTWSALSRTRDVASPLCRRLLRGHREPHPCADTAPSSSPSLLTAGWASPRPAKIRRQRSDGASLTAGCGRDRPRIALAVWGLGAGEEASLARPAARRPPASGSRGSDDVPGAARSPQPAARLQRVPRDCASMLVPSYDNASDCRLARLGAPSAIFRSHGTSYVLAKHVLGHPGPLRVGTSVARCSPTCKRARCPGTGDGRRRRQA